MASPNVSVHYVVLDAPTRRAICAANAADAALDEHGLRMFEDRIARTCAYVAGSSCRS